MLISSLGKQSEYGSSFAPSADICVAVAEHPALKHAAVLILASYLDYLKSFFFFIIVDESHKIKKSVGVVIHL